MYKHAILTLALLLGLAGSASAQSLATQEIREPAFLMLDRVGTESRWGAQLHLTMPTDRYPEPAELEHEGARMDLFARWMANLDRGNQRVRLGVYGQLAGSHIYDDQPNSYAISNKELGVIGSIGSGTWDVLIRGGALLPNSQGEMPGLVYRPSTVAKVGSFARYIDIAGTAVETTWLRWSVSPRVSRGRFFAQLDVGQDLLLGGSGLHEFETENGSFVHSALALGMRASTFAFTAEIAGVVYWANEFKDSSSAAIYGGTARYLGKSFEPYVGLVGTLGIADHEHVALVIGVDGTLP